MVQRDALGVDVPEHLDDLSFLHRRVEHYDVERGSLQVPNRVEGVVRAGTLGRLHVRSRCGQPSETGGDRTPLVDPQLGDNWQVLRNQVARLLSIRVRRRHT